MTEIPLFKKLVFYILPQSAAGVNIIKRETINLAGIIFLNS